MIGQKRFPNAAFIVPDQIFLICIYHIVRNFRQFRLHNLILSLPCVGNDSNLLIVFYVQIVPDDFVMQLHRF
ncbi:hypothetical protein CYE02_11535 [Klebsiella pneumoniae]|nr:hypothetical protein CYE02_11535 [Klebsiella pneumoniae]